MRGDKGVRCERGGKGVRCERGERGERSERLERPKGTGGGEEMRGDEVCRVCLGVCMGW